MIDKVELYLKATLGVSVAPAPWQEQEELPFFLTDLYQFFQTSLLESPCLLAIAKSKEDETPATIEKHFRQIQKRWDGHVIYVHSFVSSYNRKRLIDHKVPFIIPGNQMYLPFLGIDLREHFKKLRTAITTLSPSTQTVILHALIHGVDKAHTSSGLASLLGYTPMTMTRALDELVSTGLGKVELEGKERILTFHDSKKSLWERSQPFLRSPVKKRIWITPIQTNTLFMQAGLSALAQFSLLAAPNHSVFAVGMNEWQTIKRQEKFTQLTVAEPESYEVEIWSYSPQLFAKESVVDKFSLFLSLKDNFDERVEKALHEMMEKVIW